MQMGKNNNKEASRRYLEKIKSDPVKRQKYLQNVAMKMKIRRAKLKELANKNKKLLESKREKDRLRQRKYWKNLHNNAKQQEDVVNPYNSKQTFGKAFKKVEKSLPQALDKKIILLKALCKKYFPPENHVMESTPETNLAQVKEFYSREDISVQSACKKDTFICNGEIFSKRFMIMTVTEAFQIFNIERVGNGISKTRSYQCRHRHVKLSSKTPHNMCVCM